MTMPTGLEWYDDAACIGKPTEWFFPESKSPITTRRHEEAGVAVCNTCSVRADCLQWAIDNHVNYGTWGGVPEAVRFPKRSRRTKRPLSVVPDPIIQPSSTKEAQPA